MILAGDEFGQTQQGNNNAYCQDNEISWLNWEWNDDQKVLVQFVQTFIKFWHAQPAQAVPLFPRPGDAERPSKISSGSIRPAPK